MKNSELFVKYLKKHGIYDEFIDDFYKLSSRRFRSERNRPCLLDEYLEYCDYNNNNPCSILDNAFIWNELYKDSYYNDIFRDLSNFNFKIYYLQLNKNIIVL